jgi:RHS repeat-associated protein
MLIETPNRARVANPAATQPPKSPKTKAFEGVVMYYGYRFYDPETGRWPSRDPIEENGGVNLYGFVGNDGLNDWDYLGYWEEGPGGSRWSGGKVIDGGTFMDSLESEIWNALHTKDACALDRIILKLYKAGYTRAMIEREFRDALNPEEGNRSSAIMLVGLTAALDNAGKGGVLIPDKAQCKCTDPVTPVPVKGPPKPTPKFKPPTNPPQLPPKDLPPGTRLFRGKPTEQYPNGYWKLEKRLDNGGWQGINPSTGKPADGRQDYHVEFPVGYKGPYDN